MKRRGFTLVELLVALGIVVVLCALVFAACGPARETARRRACASNMHQWGLAMAMYTQDYDGVEPQKGVSLTYYQLGLPPFNHAFQFIHDYKLDAHDVRWCPSSHYSAHNRHFSPGRYASYWLTGTWGIDGEDPFPVYSSRYGIDVPLVVCDMHNTDTDFDDQPTWAQKWVQTLRFDQHIDFKQYPVHTPPMDE